VNVQKQVFQAEALNHELIYIIQRKSNECKVLGMNRGNTEREDHS
jgi:hypothetical protein